MRIVTSETEVKPFFTYEEMVELCYGTEVEIEDIWEAFLEANPEYEDSGNIDYLH